MKKNLIIIALANLVVLLIIFIYGMKYQLRAGIRLQVINDERVYGLLVDRIKVGEAQDLSLQDFLVARRAYFQYELDGIIPEQQVLDLIYSKPDFSLAKDYKAKTFVEDMRERQ